MGQKTGLILEKNQQLTFVRFLLSLLDDQKKVALDIYLSDETDFYYLDTQPITLRSKPCDGHRATVLGQVDLRKTYLFISLFEILNLMALSSLWLSFFPMAQPLILMPSPDFGSQLPLENFILPKKSDTMTDCRTMIQKG